MAVPLAKIDKIDRSGQKWMKAYLKKQSWMFSDQCFFHILFSFNRTLHFEIQIFVQNTFERYQKQPNMIDFHGLDPVKVKTKTETISSAF